METDGINALAMLKFSQDFCGKAGVKLDIPQTTAQAAVEAAIATSAPPPPPPPSPTPSPAPPPPPSPPSSKTSTTVSTPKPESTPFYIAPAFKGVMTAPYVASSAALGSSTLQTAISSSATASVPSSVSRGADHIANLWRSFADNESTVPYGIHLPHSIQCCSFQWHQWRERLISTRSISRRCYKTASDGRDRHCGWPDVGKCVSVISGYLESYRLSSSINVCLRQTTWDLMTAGEADLTPRCSNHNVR